MNFDIKAFGRKCLRVWYVLKKPHREEYITVTKVAIVSTLAIGLIGFIISLIVRTITP